MPNVLYHSSVIDRRPKSSTSCCFISTCTTCFLLHFLTVSVSDFRTTGRYIKVPPDRLRTPSAYSDGSGNVRRRSGRQLPSQIHLSAQHAILPRTPWLGLHCSGSSVDAAEEPLKAFSNLRVVEVVGLEDL